MVWFTQPLPSPKFAACGVPMWMPKHSFPLDDRTKGGVVSEIRYSNEHAPIKGSQAESIHIVYKVSVIQEVFFRAFR